MKSIEYLLPLFAVCVLTVSCHKSSQGEDDIDNGPVPVTLKTNVSSNVVATKSGVEKWKKQDLYLYAFKTGKVHTDKDSILLNNVKVTAPNDGVPGTAYDIEVKDTAGHYFYYTADKSTYEFFGYYIDTIEKSPAPAITAGQDVKLPITLDGSNDIMLATTDKEKDIEAAGAGVQPTDVYSAYSARRNVIPNLIFKHQLSRFVFRIIAGNKEGTRIKVDSLTLHSDSQCDLVIVNRAGNTGIFNPSAPMDFHLKNHPDSTKGVTDFVPRLDTIDPTSHQYHFKDIDKIGESIMVIPSTEHKLNIWVQQYDSLGAKVGDQFKYYYDLNTDMVTTSVPHPDKKFLSGYQYNVNVVVYGREKVTVKVTLSEWGAGGTIVLDDETEWGDEPAIGVETTEKTEQYLWFYKKGAKGAEAIVKDAEVKVWDKTLNEMVYAKDTTYSFVKEQEGGKTGVVLVYSSGKTVVDSVIVKQP